MESTCQTCGEPVSYSSFDGWWRDQNGGIYCPEESHNYGPEGETHLG